MCSSDLTIGRRAIPIKATVANTIESEGIKGEAARVGTGAGIGGIIGGILADYIGRKRTLIYAILAYSLTTGLTALAWSWTSFIALRFVVGLAIGSEWGTGAAMVAEMWPPQHRGKGAGLMQCGLGIGFFLASLAWLFVSPLGPTDRKSTRLNSSHT